MRLAPVSHWGYVVGSEMTSKTLAAGAGIDFSTTTMSMPCPSGTLANPKMFQNRASARTVLAGFLEVGDAVSAAGF